MKKILKLVFILSLLTLALVACKKDKGEQSTDSSQSETSQASDGYQQVLYVNEAKFNISGDIVVLFSEELDKKQDFKKLVEVEGLDGDITVMPFINKLIIKGDFKKDNPYNIIQLNNKVAKFLKSRLGIETNRELFNFLNLKAAEQLKIYNYPSERNRKYQIRHVYLQPTTITSSEYING